MSDNKKVNKLLGEVSKKYGISKEQLESAAQSGNIENLLKNTNPNQSKQIESVLSDPEKAKKLLLTRQTKLCPKTLHLFHCLGVLQNLIELIL